MNDGFIEKGGKAPGDVPTEVRSQATPPTRPLTPHRYEEVGGQCWGECRVCGNVERARVHQVDPEPVEVTEIVEDTDDGRAEWLATGIERGWCGPPVCAQHDGLPSTAEEDAAFETGDDPCLFVVRPYVDEDERTAVEANHSPSIWRK